MKRALSIALLAACSSQVLAADFGVGVSVQSNDAWIYAPIDVTPGFRIEPSIRFVSAESESQTQSSSFGLPITTSVKSDTDQYELAVGPSARPRWENPYGSITALELPTSTTRRSSASRRALGRSRTSSNKSRRWMATASRRPSDSNT